MTEAVTAGRFDISVVIPALDAEQYLPGLFRSIEAQTLLPNEIVIVDSSRSNATAELVRSWQGSVPIVFKRLDFAYPGHARNVGVASAKGQWIAFIDCRTIPDPDWLEKSALVAEQSGAEFVGALCMSDADTRFKQTLRAATHGFGPMKTMVGSLFLRSAYEGLGGLVPDVRAGEDMEFMVRLRDSSVKSAVVPTPTIVYSGFVGSLGGAVRKWCMNNFAITDIEVRNNQKYIYLLFFLTLVFLAVYNWNPTFAPREGQDALFVPNITKIFVASVALLYVIFRGLVRPLRGEAKISFLLPWRWVEIAFVGFCLDLAKAPGMIWGAVKLLMRRLRRT